ncbi:MAG: class I SAM-dependent methyltransferase [Sporichthyaceae bacterium]
MDQYRQANLQNWESRVLVQLATAGAGVAELVEDPSALSGVVAHDAAALGDLTGKRAVHLQCHIGVDALSLARLGADVTGLDFSPTAIEAARELCGRAQVRARFVVADVYEAPVALDGETFDLVYTGVGALCWLPDITGWARVVAALLAPGGSLFVRELHPVLFTLDDERDDGLLVVRYPYFNTAEPQFVDSPTSYDNRSVELAAPQRYVWNHGLGEIVTGLVEAGMRITGLVEHHESEWHALPWMVPTGDGRYGLPAGREKVPLMYTLTAVKDPL